MCSYLLYCTESKMTEHLLAWYFLLYFFRFYLVKAEAGHGSYLTGKETERVKEASGDSS